MASRSTFAVACVLLASASGAHQACAARGPALSRVGPPRAHVQLMPLAVGAKRAKKGDAAAVAPPVAAGKDAEDADPAAGLEVWLADNGVAMGAVCIEQRELRDIGWGLRAAAPAAAGAVLATVPATRLLAADAGAEHKLGESLGVAIPEQQWALPLALRLLREQLHPASSWAGYTRSLPGRFGAHPTSYDDDELRALKSDWLSSRLCDQRDLIDALAGAAATTASAAVLEAFPAARPTISDLRWACAAAASRALAVGGASGEEPALVPLLDLCNHAHAPSCEVRRDAKTGAVMLVALAPIEKGEALTLNYGNIGAAERVLRYGFVDEEADPDDFVIVNWDGLALDAAHTLGEPKQMGAALHVGSAPKQDAHTPADPDTPDDLADFQKKAMHALGLLAGADGSFPTEGVRVYADRLDGRLLAALRVLYARGARWRRCTRTSACWRTHSRRGCARRASASQCSPPAAAPTPHSQPASAGGWAASTRTCSWQAAQRRRARARPTRALHTPSASRKCTRPSPRCATRRARSCTPRRSRAPSRRSGRCSNPSSGAPRSRTAATRGGSKTRPR
ncbi:hypothetical protein T492DRAFT_913195 [Pavlovales sp. CCMP2436]|nr:hypothetical protein T492DRAFT_913195 [Pavlovales sp. CCMP2436]